jgi:hypothetical protein
MGRREERTKGRKRDVKVAGLIPDVIGFFN